MPATLCNERRINKKTRLSKRKKSRNCNRRKSRKRKWKIERRERAKNKIEIFRGRDQMRINRYKRVLLRKNHGNKGRMRIKRYKRWLLRNNHGNRDKKEKAASKRKKKTKEK